MTTNILINIESQTSSEEFDLNAELRQIASMMKENLIPDNDNNKLSLKKKVIFFSDLIIHLQRLLQRCKEKKESLRSSGLLKNNDDQSIRSLVDAEKKLRLLFQSIEAQRRQAMVRLRRSKDEFSNTNVIGHRAKNSQKENVASSHTTRLRKKSW